ncbi:hypothetical protein [Cereibacter azotoformans]|uniref:hypothetical protein n=1 Tax=Cereibacter azotoformans TaxID=43057 RepID=UPI00117A0A0D|nr:hypothetical protein [Cereibacter azotoformans]
MTGQIVSARRTADGIVLHRLVPSEVEGEVTMRLIEVLPDDPDWLEAVAALPPDDVAPIEPAPPLLAVLRAEAICGINRVAGEIRRRYVTVMPGEEMLYLRKEAEARAYLADPDPDPADYPLIMAEEGITAPTAWHVAQVYLGLSAVWISLAAPLETARLGAIAQIELAEDAETIRAIVDAACVQIAAISNPAPEQPA